MEKIFHEKISEVVARKEEDDVDCSDDDDDEERKGFDELFHRISISNSIIEFEYYVKNPFKTVRNIRFCLGELFILIINLV